MILFGMGSGFVFRIYFGIFWYFGNMMIMGFIFMKQCNEIRIHFYWFTLLHIIVFS